MQDMACKPNSGRGVSLRRFGQNLLPRYRRQLPHDLFAQMFVGEYPEPFSRNEGGEPVHRGLDERALSHDREYLLGVTAPAARPEACAAASGQDQAVVIRHGYWTG